MMKRNLSIAAAGLVVSLSVGCAGLKVVDPNEPKDTNTLALDTSGGGLKLVATYTCKLESMGHRFSALGKSEAEASKEVIAKCQDRTVLSFCKAENVKCVKN